jgi:pyruvate dehydrogenase E2 component (dihydrolipoamide acetyltransferase)
MIYEIVMPQLSDSMDEGKLIAWKVKPSQAVKSGDVIAEVESDKAIMEVQSFQDGVVEKLLVKEGSVVPVGTVIAKIASEKKASPEMPKEIEAAKETKEAKPKQTHKQEVHKPKEEHIKIAAHPTSPKARAKAAQYGVALEKLTQYISKTQIHAEDVEQYIKEHYFTPKAYKLLQKYRLESSLFTLNHKIDATEVQEYIDKHKIPLPQAISSMQKAIIKSVTASAQKPVYHIYEYVDATLLQKNSSYSITVWLIKIFADVMMRHDAFRSSLYEEHISIAANASIALAVADTKELYMPVIKDANRLSLVEIANRVKSFQTKLQQRSFTQEDMQGSTFGISNLGMLGVKQFDAMINKEDTAIAAIGALVENQIAITLTIDHRLVNGYEAALFMQDIKKEFQNSLNFKG